MKFLKNNGFTEEEIKEIIDKYDRDTIKELVFYQDLVEERIDYLKEYGIEDIPRLMLERIDIFFVPLKKIKELFSHYEKDSVVASLNYDASIFDEMR